MNKNRYVERELLCKYDLSEEFFDKLGVDVEDVTPLRKVFVLLTDKGKKILKIVDSDKNRLNFIDNALSFISQNFSDILSYYRNKSGNIYEIWNKNTYVVLDMIEGREAAFSNPIEVEICSRAIAKMHKASIGLVDKIGIKKMKENMGIYLPKYYEESYKDLVFLKEYVSKFKYKNEFDMAFIENVDTKLVEIKKASSLLALSSYRDILEDDSKLVLCHNDLAHHNFIIDGSEVKIIDFDYCNINTRIIDIANYSSKVIKNFAYDIDKFRTIIESYNSINELTKEEVKMLYCILSFPSDFVTIVKNYYYKEKSWEEGVFISRLKNKLENETFREKFLTDYMIAFNEYFY